MAIKMKNDYEIQYTSYFLEKVISLIKENYFMDISCEILYQAAIQGMMGVLDKYSTYEICPKDGLMLCNKQENPVEEYKINDNVNVIKIKTINQKAVEDVTQIMDCMIDKKETDKLIIDLRDNAGGMTDSLYKMCALFFSEKEIYIKIKKNKREKYITKKIYEKIKNIIVLVNEKTMSSAEIMAAAFQDNGKIIIGKKTYGKGVAQKTYKTFDGGYILLTTEEYLRINGKKIQDEGIIPDIIVENEDNILRIAYEAVEGKYIEKKR